MSPAAVAELVRRTAGSPQDRERADLLSFAGGLDDPADRAAWLTLRAAPPAWLERVTIKPDGSDAPVDANLVPQPGDRFRISLEKRVEDAQLRLLFGAALAHRADELAAARLVRIADLAVDQQFASHRAAVEPWDETAPPARPEPAALADPRALADDLTGRNAVPADPGPWLLQDAPARESAAFLAWRGLAAPRLLAAIADRVSLSEGRLSYRFEGPPRFRLTPTAAEAEALFPCAAEGAAWVYGGTAEEAETRHLLLASEWARSGAAGAPGVNALESAKAGYRAYVERQSRETLEALANVRRQVLDETATISERAAALTSAIWRDFAIAAAPFVIGLSEDIRDAGGGWVAPVLALAAAMVLAATLAAQRWIDRRWFDAQDRLRAEARAAIAYPLTAEAIRTLSDDPIREARATYDWVATGVTWLYALTVAGLLAYAGAGIWAAAQRLSRTAVPVAVTISIEPVSPTAS
jgi:hypothetical protein